MDEAVLRRALSLEVDEFERNHVREKIFIFILLKDSEQRDVPRSLDSLLIKRADEHRQYFSNRVELFNLLTHQNKNI